MGFSNNSFSKTSNWILIIFVAKWSWEFACFVSVVSNTLLFCRKRRKLCGKKKTQYFPGSVSRNDLVGFWRDLVKILEKSTKIHRKCLKFNFPERKTNNWLEYNFSTIFESRNPVRAPHSRPDTLTAQQLRCHLRGTDCYILQVTTLGKKTYSALPW